MGRQPRTPHPSPLQMLAILQARAEGLSAHEIHRRTGYSNMSVLRWFTSWGHEAKTLENIFRENEIYDTGLTFDDFYPKKQKPLPDPTLTFGEPRPAPHRFDTQMGRK